MGARSCQASAWLGDASGEDGGAAVHAVVSIAPAASTAIAAR
jgi:hypothetical protein